MTSSTEINRLRWQSRRGALELDLILNKYTGDHYPHVSIDMQRKFQALLQEDDPKLMDWLVYRNATFPKQYRHIIKDILDKTSP